MSCPEAVCKAVFAHCGWNLQAKAVAVAGRIGRARHSMIVVFVVVLLYGNGIMLVEI